MKKRLRLAIYWFRQQGKYNKTRLRYKHPYFNRGVYCCVKNFVKAFFSVREIHWIQKTN